MLSARPLVLVGALAVSLGGCSKSASVSTGSSAPASGSQPVAKPEGGDRLSNPKPSADVEKTEIRVSVEGIDDILATGLDILKRIDPDNTTSDPLADVQAMLLAQGFAPAFINNIDLSGQHVLWAAMPVDDASDAEAFAATVSVMDPRKVIEALPEGNRAQPLGDGVWRLDVDKEQLLMKEAGKELLVSESQDDLSRAAKLRAEAGSGRRIRARAWNIPTDDIDPADLLDLPAGNPIVKQLTAIAKELKGIGVEADLGSKRPIQVVASAEGPFAKLGLDPLGKPRSASTALEKRLPGNPFFVASLAYGDPTMVHKTIDKVVPLDQIPAPFDGIVKRALEGAHGLLDQVANDVVIAMYLNSKGQATFVIAADVKADENTTKGIRAINGSLVEALTAHAAMQGKNKNAKFEVQLKNDGIKFSGVKADRLLVKIPKDFREDFAKASVFMKGDSLETVSFVKGNTALIAIGSGGRALAADVAKSLGSGSKAALANDSAMTSLRSGMEGCQVCVTFDAKEYLRLRLQLLAEGSDKTVAKDAKAKLKQLGKVSGDVDLGAGLRFEADNAAFGFVVPAETVSLSADAIATLKQLNEFVDSPAALGKTEVAVKSASPK